MADDADLDDDDLDDIEELELDKLRAEVELKRANVRMTDLMADRIEYQLSTGTDTTSEINSLVAELREFVQAKLQTASTRIEPATLDVQSPSQIVLAAGIVAAAALIIAGHPSYGLCFLAAGPALALLPHVTRHLPDLMKDSSSRG